MVIFEAQKISFAYSGENYLLNTLLNSGCVGKSSIGIPSRQDWVLVNAYDVKLKLTLKSFELVADGRKSPRAQW